MVVICYRVPQVRSSRNLFLNPGNVNKQTTSSSYETCAPSLLIKMAAILKQSSKLFTRSAVLFRPGVSASRFFNTNDVMENMVAHNRIVETDENIYVSVDMPGCGKDGVKASLSVKQFERKSLCVKGCREDNEVDVKNRNYSCSIDLPEYVSTNNVKAELVNGLLTFTFPKVGVEQEGKKWFEEINVK